MIAKIANRISRKNAGSSDFVMQKNTNLTPIPIFEIQSRNSVKLAELDIERSINVE
ncbi:Helicase-like [Geitlerinema sp. FC II]|nr:Helicase-like [Geitlerinema sp. FC II]